MKGIERIIHHFVVSKVSILLNFKKKKKGNKNKFKGKIILITGKAPLGLEGRHLLILQNTVRRPSYL